MIPLKIMLTSFGITEDDDSGAANNFDFFRLPPLDMRSLANGFAPEYSLLILCDKLIFDRSSFEWVTEAQSLPLFGPTGRTLALLRSEGFLELRDYRGILAENNDLLAKMTENDLLTISQWSAAMRTSSRIWRTFIDGLSPQSRRVLQNDWSGDHIAVSMTLEHQEYSRHRAVLSSYLSYVNANLILSNEMDAGLHDWEDFQPFYRRKFLAVGHERLELPARADASRQLFDVAFPEFAIRSPEHFIDLLNHRRVRELRTLIEEASRGEVEFDEGFARSVFHELLGIEKTLGKRRRLLGYLTFPIGYLPLIGNYAQFVLQEASSSMMEQRLKKKYRWFYLLSDLAEKESRRNA